MTFSLSFVALPPPVVSVGLHLESGRHEVGHVDLSETLGGGQSFTLQLGEDQLGQPGGHGGRVEVVGHVVE